MKKGKMRLVVKVGSSSIAAAGGGVDPAKMSLLVSAVSKLREAGHQVVLVSSGAVASGYQRLGYQQRPRSLAAKQAAAAIGQSLLMQTYTQMFAAHHFSVAQILLTRETSPIASATSTLFKRCRCFWTKTFCRSSTKMTRYLWRS